MVSQSGITNWYHKVLSQGGITISQGGITKWYYKVASLLYDIHIELGTTTM